MKKFNVNESTCIGCGACIAVDPEHFDFNDDGLAEVISNENIETNSANNALASCPVNAITLNEVEESAGCGCGNNCQCGDDCDCANEEN